VDRFLRHATLLVLLLLALVVWFETSLFGEERGALRLVVGLLCVYVAVQSVERQRLHDAFKDLLRALQQFRAEADPGAAPVPSARERREAADILIAALRRGGPTAEVALSNLRRVTGQDHGTDADAWQRWLDSQPRA
jgi:hypothetical protein